MKCGSYTFNSRLIVGTGKYPSFEIAQKAIEASGADGVTVAVKKVNIKDLNEPLLQDYIDPKKYIYIPNTAGCFTADDAINTLQLARDIGGWNLVKLEVLSDPTTLYPHMVDTIEAAKLLVKDGFEVMVYTNDDPVLCKELEEIGCVAVMPLGAPIGSGRGIQNPFNISMIIKNAKVPIVVDAGLRSASHAALAMELGADAVLINSAIARAGDPVRMAKAMSNAVIAGRDCFESGEIPKVDYGIQSSEV